MSDNDDIQVGRILSRREILGLFGTAGAAALLVACGSDGGGSALATEATSTTAGASAATTATPQSGTNASSTMPVCVVRPAVTEGPYFVDEKLNRSDIRSDSSNNTVKPGAPLALTFNVGQVANGCSPLANAQVDVWHCDALGVYSDVQDQGFNTRGQKFLRGYQMTDSSGRVTFTTIYPGWYQGRAVHIHFKIRTGNAEFTSQIFFDDAVSAELFKSTAPYSQKGTNGITLNARDGIYKSELLVPVTKNGESYAATFDIGLQKV